MGRRRAETKESANAQTSIESAKLSTYMHKENQHTNMIPSKDKINKTPLLTFSYKLDKSYINTQLNK